MTDARALSIEIIESRKGDQKDSAGDSIVVPNKIVINGVEILAPAEHPVVIHEIVVDGLDAAMVTLTMFVRDLTIKSTFDED